MVFITDEGFLKKCVEMRGTITFWLQVFYCSCFLVFIIVYSSVPAESWAILEGLELAQSRSVKFLWFKSDLLQASNLLNCQAEISWHVNIII